MAENKLEVHLVTPEREVWTGEADMVIARTTEGDLGVLRGHAPLLGKLKISALAIRNGNDTQRAAVDSGFLHVKDDRVDILGERAELEHEIDVEQARRRRDEAASRVDEDEYYRAELAKADVRLGLTG